MRLNCDLGESFSIYRLCDESKIIPLIDQANIACGFHGGDPSTISKSLALCASHNVVVGAHPSYPDLQGFGRRSMSMSSAELIDCILYQLSALSGLAALKGASVEYVKPHGALYNDMMKNEKVFISVLQAVAIFNKNLSLMVLATPNYKKLIESAASYGVSLLFEAFADRRYTQDGQLSPRTEPNAVLNDEQAVHQAQSFIEGKAPFPIDSLCVHGDSDSALTMVKHIRLLLQEQDAK
jgi:UPF0271 protein